MVSYAQSILYDPVKKKVYAAKLKKSENVYHAALKEFLRKVKKQSGTGKVEGDRSEELKDTNQKKMYTENVEIALYCEMEIKNL